MTTGILLVDDDLEDQYIFRDAMDSINSPEPVHTEQNGVTALAYLVGLPPGKLPCVILADLNMPKMNGVDFLDNVKNHNHLKNIPVVIYSTSESKSEQEACIRRGAYAYITKPLSYQQSMDVAKKVVELCRKVNLKI